ncbi:MAG TPA: ATP-binding protein [Chitinophagaceae bacterium]|nr:ATP-binding protein [Chitinophagaceae bacterium]
MNRFRLYVVAFFFSLGKVSAQDSSAVIFNLDSIPRNGLILNKGWTFMPGDNPEWSNPDFNDDNWKPENPTDEIHHLPEVRNASIGWFRLKLNVAPGLRGKSIGMLASGFGAMEIYLNGKLAYYFGKPAKDYQNEITRFFTNNLLSLTFDTMASQVLAVRYSFHKQNLYIKFANKRPILKIELKEINQGITENIKENNFESTLRTIQVSFYLPLGFLLLFLFMSFRPQKEYLFAGIFCLCLFLAILFHILALTEPVTVNHSNSFLLVTQVMYIIGAISFIHSMYVLYKMKKTIFFYLILAYGIFSIPFYFISYDSSGFVNAFFFPVINLEFLRLNIIAVYRRRKGAMTLLITSIVFALTIISYIYFAINHYNSAAALFQGISFIIPGLGLSIFYAGEFARTASGERQRTIEVEKLSKEMIQKEQEKQQILSEQNVTLEKQVKERTSALEKSLKELKETEEQLIQREKMASLGELTAGIAHEIQNPLNFVNNFSEINIELIDELKEELKKGKTQDAEKVAEDIRNNNEKISFHGKRADSIVKGMLQHSRNSSGQKELTDINQLADECLRLSYHGMRAKDKSFNAQTVTDFDNTLPLINVAPQDIGRVFLNLFTNAFYSVMKKAKEKGEAYQPEVSVKTGKTEKGIFITVKDNGDGVPQKVVDKIFQPFFTTKPTGEGTGLGLSMSYDIITQNHGGKIKVETNEGEFAAFTIILPL